jgi:hypothetical protein
VAVLAGLGWITVAVFWIFGIGFTPEMSRFFSVMLSVATVATITAVVGYVITPLVAAHGIGVRAGLRAGLRAGRDRKPQGRHVRGADDATIHYLETRRLMGDPAAEASQWRKQIAASTARAPFTSGLAMAAG